MTLQNGEIISHLYGNFHCFEASAGALQRGFEIIISPLDVFYSKNGTFPLGAQRGDHQRGAAAQIIRLQLRGMQLRDAPQPDGLPLLRKVRAELLQLAHVEKAVFKNGLGEGRLPFRQQLRRQKHRHRVRREAGIRQGCDRPAGRQPAVAADGNGIRPAGDLTPALPQGVSLEYCEECGEPIPVARQRALPGVRLCVHCREEADREEKAVSLYNRKGSKDSQLR